MRNQVDLYVLWIFFIYPKGWLSPWVTFYFFSTCNGNLYVCVTEYKNLLWSTNVWDNNNNHVQILWALLFLFSYYLCFYYKEDFLGTPPCRSNNMENETIPFATKIHTSLFSEYKLIGMTVDFVSFLLHFFSHTCFKGVPMRIVRKCLDSLFCSDCSVWIDKEGRRVFI